VAVLDRQLLGMRWTSEAPVVEAKEPYSAREWQRPTVDIDQVRALPAGWKVLDVRSGERYRGEVEPIDPVAGHIPGAVSLPFAELAPNGRFLTPDELRARFEAAGVRSGDDAVAYCGSGVTACVLVLAAEVAGIGAARLYPGSWSEWSGRDLAVERG
jgi:thiosulfate/3-mercaptopyruvate sulfurtransferase